MPASRHGRMILHAVLMLFCIAALASSLTSPPAKASEAAAWSALREGGIVLFRHTLAPGTGDPANFRVDDCSTQRNLSEEGRAQARRIGERFRAEGITVGEVLTSEWCRTYDTAELAFPGMARRNSAFSSFFQDRSNQPQTTAKAKAILSAWKGPEALVVVTHQVNITALTGVAPASGEGVVVRARGDTIEVIGRVSP